MHGKICVLVEMRQLKAENAQLKAVTIEKPKSPWLLDEEPRARKRYAQTGIPGIEEKHLRRVIDKVLVYLEVPNRYDWERLIYLTAIVESDGGRYLKQIRGPAKSPFQTEPETERDILRWCKAKRPELYRKIRTLRFPAHLEIHEAECNLAYAVALCYLEYVHRKVDPKGMSVKELCQTWKKNYNTYLGKGTVKRALYLVEKFNVNL